MRHQNFLWIRISRLGVACHNTDWSRFRLTYTLAQGQGIKTSACEKVSLGKLTGAAFSVPCLYIPWWLTLRQTATSLSPSVERQQTLEKRSGHSTQRQTKTACHGNSIWLIVHFPPRCSKIFQHLFFNAQSGHGCVWLCFCSKPSRYNKLYFSRETFLLHCFMWSSSLQ